MGTMIAMLLVLGTLVGCANETLTNVKNAPLDLGGTAVDWVVEMETDADTVSGKEGEKIAEYSYTVPVLHAASQDGSFLEDAKTDAEAQYLEIAKAFNEPFSAWTEASENQRKFIESAQEVGELTELTTPFFDELTCSVYQTAHLVSVSGVYYSYAGGAHPNTILLSWNFDLDTGIFFDPQLLEQGSGLGAAVHTELLRQAQETAAQNGMKPEEYFWSNYESILKDWSSYAVSFDETGMTVAFSPYELACYAAGAQVFHISYDWLSPRLNADARAFLGIEETED